MTDHPDDLPEHGLQDGTGSGPAPEPMPGLNGSGNGASAGPGAVPRYPRGLIALEHVRTLNVFVFPLIRGGKKPAFEGWTRDATQDEATIIGWWNRDDYNIGILTGRPNGATEGDYLTAVDYDNKDGKVGFDTYHKHTAAGLLDTRRSKTPNGVHALFWSPTPISNSVGRIARHVDVRGVGGYIVAPGSEIANGGGKYAWIENSALTPQPLPTELLIAMATRSETERPENAVGVDPDLLDSPRAIERAIYYLINEAPEAIEGKGGDNTTFLVAQRVRAFGISEELCLELMDEHYNEQKCSPRWTDEDLRKKVRNAYTYASLPPGNANPELEFAGLETSSTSSTRIVNVTPATVQQPFDLFDPFAKFIVPEFPLETLPPVLLDFVVPQAEVIGVDVSSMAMCALTACSSAISHEFRLKMLRHGNWCVSPRIWMLLCGDSSTKKTPTIDAATQPLEDYEMEQYELYRRKLQAYEEFKDSQGKDKDYEPEEPQEPGRFVAMDSTPEKLGEILARDPRGLLVKVDEFTAWLGGMDKYGGKGGGGHNRGFWLTAYNSRPYIVDRITRGSIFVKNLSISLIAGVQPERFAELKGLTSDGLLQRFLPIMMELARPPIDRPCDTDAYDELIQTLIAAEPEELTLSDAALASMNELRMHLHTLSTHAGGLPRGFQAFLVKLEGIAGSLALILHMAADPSGGAAKPVARSTVENVHRLVQDFLIPHALEFYHAGGSVTDGERLRRIASWILTAHAKRFVASDLTSNVADFRGLTLREVNERLSPLVAAGWLLPANEGLALMNRSWTVNPRVHAEFTLRAELEEDAKAKLAELMNSRRRRQQRQGST